MNAIPVTTTDQLMVAKEDSNNLNTGDCTEDFVDLTGYGGHHGDFVMVMLDSEIVIMMKITAVDSKTKGMKPVDPHMTCVDYSCQEKVDEVLF